jgi:hypothetical protein
MILAHPSIQAFAKTIQSRLEDTAFDDEEIKRTIMEAFERDLKLRFLDADQTYCIKFGRDRDADRKAGIQRGRIIVKG